MTTVYLIAVPSGVSGVPAISPDEFLAVRPLPAGLDVRRDGELVRYFDRSPGPLSPGGGRGMVMLLGFLGLLWGLVPGGLLLSVLPWPPPAWAWLVGVAGSTLGLFVGVALGLWIAQPAERSLTIDSASGLASIVWPGSPPNVWQAPRARLRVVVCPIRGTFDTRAFTHVRASLRRCTGAFAVLDTDEGEAWILLATDQDAAALAGDLRREAALPEPRIVEEEVVGEVDRWLLRRT